MTLCNPHGYVSWRFVTETVTFRNNIQVEYTDILWLAVKLYNDPTLKENLVTKFERKEAGRERQYTELNTGLWWERTEADIERRFPVSELLRFATIRHDS